MVSVLTWSVIDHGFEPQFHQTKGHTISICCFSAKHATVWPKSKDWLALNQNIVFEWSDMLALGLLLQ